MDSIEKEKIDTATEPKDCFSCKMISGTVLLLASVHVFTRGASAKLRSTKLISAIFGTSLGYTGLARLLDLYPFNMKNMNMPNKESIKNVS